MGAGRSGQSSDIPLPFLWVRFTRIQTNYYAASDVQVAILLTGAIVIHIQPNPYGLRLCMKQLCTLDHRILRDHRQCRRSRQCEDYVHLHKMQHTYFSQGLRVAYNIIVSIFDEDCRVGKPTSCQIFQVIDTCPYKMYYESRIKAYQQCHSLHQNYNQL